ncbi:hypothetical protein BU17DRAFT_44955 [Hysterangium stoloniferum]|nr:hypothetical protein BU17DRAFT_44955 [Hysterangium stoloniferum]
MSFRPSHPRSIRGDQLEQSRKRLERDIDNKIPSFPSLSSSNSPGGDHDDASVEFARHGSHHMRSFYSFEHPSYLDSDFHSRHGEDDSIVLDPDLGHTMSTAAHHASALTLSAGLHGRNYTPGKFRQEDIEFDPDRPLQQMLNSRIRDGLSAFDVTTRSRSKSRHDLPTFDPVVVDSTADLDRLLQTGHRRPNISPSGASLHYLGRSHSHPEPGASDVSDADISPPRLSKALGEQFSPKRPRSSPNISNMAQARRIEHSTLPRMTTNVSKPNRSKGQAGPSNLNPARHGSKRMDQEKPSPGSQFSKMPGVSARDIESQIRSRNATEDKENEPTPRAPKRGIFASTPGVIHGKRPPLSNIVNGDFAETNQKSNGHVRLPDVTGLTSAVQSPVKSGEVYRQPDVGNPSLAMDLVDALDTLQSRLQALERENSVSHRRVRELEYDLEECKADIARQRAKMKDRERQVNEEAELWREKVKVREARERLHEEEIGNYRRIVEEKKSLEALVTTMQAHLSRLTAELDLQKYLVTGLRADVRATENIQEEVEVLRAKVERLAGEVERLKAFVEEGLRERKRTRDTSTRNEPLTVEELQPELRDQEPDEDSEDEGAYNYEPEEEEEEEDQESEPQPFREESDQGLEPLPEPSRSRRYIDDTELARVEVEMRERRSERSPSKSGSSLNSRANDSGNGSSMGDGRRNSAIRESAITLQATRHASHGPPADTSIQAQHASRPSKVTNPKDNPPTTPFPQIRGSRMERLFFSAPEHNARTCHICHRRRRRDNEIRVPQAEVEDEDEGEDEAGLIRSYLRYKERRRKNEANDTGPGQKNGAERDTGKFPPQTILAKVIRDLEDDFSHYKAIYLELAEQYGVIDASSNVAKRNILAEHLHEVIDTLEQKGDHIASLYDLLNFQDKPNTRPGRVPPFSKVKHSHFA